MISYRIVRDPLAAEAVAPWLQALSLADGVVALRELDDTHAYVHLVRPWDARPDAGATWLPAGDGWEFCVSCPHALRPELLRRRGGDVVTVPECDRMGRVWPVPLVLEALPRDDVLLRLPLGADWQPVAEPWQSGLIGAARWARREILAAIPGYAPGDPVGDVALELDLALAAQAAAEALCAVVALPVAVLQHLGALDHVLVGRVLQTVAGVGGQVVERLAAAVSDGGPAASGGDA